MAEPSGELRTALEAARTKYDLPALGVAIVAAGKVEEVVAVGVRKWGDPTPVTDADPFHLGSNTKAMTATLAGMLVERGKIGWEATLADIFPEVMPNAKPAWRDVTLKQLLMHRAGMPKESWPGSGAYWARNRQPMREQRAEYVRRALAEEPDSPPGTKFLYSNRGYVVAGAMLERVTGEVWEDLMRRHLFEPLGMESAGFGSAATPGMVNAPYPHHRKDNKPVPADAKADNLPALGPAGTVHSSLADYGKFALLHLNAVKGQTPLLRAETARTLHTPPSGGDYALGWVCLERSWAGGPVLYHLGDNTMNVAIIWMAPLRGFAVLVATNIAGKPAMSACDEIAAGCLTTLGRRFG